jgi:hypothetical protein
MSGSVPRDEEGKKWCANSTLSHHKREDITMYVATSTAVIWMNQTPGGDKVGGPAWQHTQLSGVNQRNALIRLGTWERSAFRIETFSA